ncbi:MAG: hypothetical protein JWR88_88 [Pseudonocardia sp.]|nr:hypothetical protein [Pseudonocardia sp.]
MTSLDLPQMNGTAIAPDSSSGAWAGFRTFLEALRKLGWWVVDGLATEDRGCWSLEGGWVPPRPTPAQMVAKQR